MGIAESQLETWSRQGATASASSLCERIQNALQNDVVLAPQNFDVFLKAIYAGQQPRCMSLLWFQRNPLPVDWTAQRAVVARFDA